MTCPPRQKDIDSRKTADGYSQSAQGRLPCPAMT